jgi:hypothetical protein
MSPIIGLCIAIVAGWLAPRPRTAAAIVVAPMLGATAAQSWYLGTGRGHNPASTTTASVAYWVVQVLIITAICGVAAALCWLRTRRSPGQRDVPSGARGAVLLAIATVAALGTTLGAMFVTDRPSHPGSGNGNPPVAGDIAIVVGLVVLVVLAVDWARKVRQSHRTSHELAH